MNLPRMSATRIFQITALALLAVGIVQVGWWLLDQHRFADSTEQRLHTLYREHATAAQAMLQSGVPSGDVMRMMPGITIEGGEAIVSPQILHKLAEERRARINQYFWESAFFLVALFACIAVIWRVLRSETEVVRQQDSFLALVSHQFKTPLASLQLSLETMSLRTLSPEQSRGLIERMLADLTRMETMVSRILDVVRLERGRVELRPEPVELAAAVERLMAHFGEQARRENVTLSVAIPRGLQVMADPLAFDVIVRNLVENAFAALPAGRGGGITIEARRASGEVEISVHDTGVGFDPAEREKLFERFSRLHVGATTQTQGTGLGLFIVRRLMQLAGGRVAAHSSGPGQGAVFTLFWPAVPASAA